MLKEFAGENCADIAHRFMQPSTNGAGKAGRNFDAAENDLVRTNDIYASLSLYL
jgi:hypothetical protein